MLITALESIVVTYIDIIVCQVIVGIFFLSEMSDGRLRYYFGAYWIVATYTTTGYGDVRPKGFEGMLFSILVMILAKIHVIYSMGLLSSTQANKQSLQVTFEEKLQV